MSNLLPAVSLKYAEELWEHCFNLDDPDFVWVVPGEYLQGSQKQGQTTEGGLFFLGDKFGKKRDADSLTVPATNSGEDYLAIRFPAPTAQQILNDMHPVLYGYPLGCQLTSEGWIVTYGDPDGPYGGPKPNLADAAAEAWLFCYANSDLPGM